MNRVLIADDDPGIREFIGHIIRRKFANTRISMAADGQEALHHLLKNQIDLGIVDFRMPKLNGIQVTRAARREGIRTNIVMLSGWATATVVHQAVNAGIQDFLEKPIIFPRILYTIQAYLRQEEIKSVKDDKTEVKGTIDGGNTQL